MIKMNVRVLKAILPSFVRDSEKGSKHINMNTSSASLGSIQLQIFGRESESRICTIYI